MENQPQVVKTANWLSAKKVEELRKLYQMKPEDAIKEFATPVEQPRVENTIIEKKE